MLNNKQKSENYDVNQKKKNKTSKGQRKIIQSIDSSDIYVKHKLKKHHSAPHRTHKKILSTTLIIKMKAA